MIYEGAVNGLASCVALLALAQSELPLEGTQPNELAVPPEASSRCGCHSDYEPDQVVEPGQAYAATAMALAARDPLFRAALVLAYRDEPRIAPTCLRCHAPAGWLDGASTPGDGSALQPEHLEGVTCDVCHRMVEPPGGTHIGDGQYVIADDVQKRGPRGTAPVTGHRTVQSDYLRSSEPCGVCHSLFNPLQRSHDADGRDLGTVFYEQRTYEEWRDSDFVGRQGCVDCHMQRVSGYSCRERVNLYPDLAVHTIVGANSFLPRAVQALYPELELGPSVAAAREAIRRQLAMAATLEIVEPRSAALRAPAGGAAELTIRLTNRTGHKLPTGYPEGRRVFLQVVLELEGRDPVIVSGRWDGQVGDLVEDAQLHTYETRHGQVGIGRSRNLALANQILSDTRIPPEGFMPDHEDMRPQGRDYGSRAPYRHWDEKAYAVPIPADVAPTTTGTITVRALHQATSGAYVRFLIDALGADHEKAQDLRRAFALAGRGEPEPMVEVSIPLLVTAAEPPDAGVVDAGGSADAGLVADAEPYRVPKPDGCGCRATPPSGPAREGEATLGLLALLGLGLGARPRRRRA